MKGRTAPYISQCWQSLDLYGRCKACKLVAAYHVACESVSVKALSDQADERTSGEPPMEHFTASSREKQALCEMAIEH